MESKDILDFSSALYIYTGIAVGFIGRWWMLRGDIRQYPTYPNGYLIHLTTGFIAAALGAVAYPALISKNFVAVTFLSLAIQQFRDIRKMEKETLHSMEGESYVPRGDTYIDGIAKSFEARNYIVMVSSLITTITTYVLKEYIESDLINITLAAILGFIIIYLLRNYTKGHYLRDIVTMKEAPLEFKDGSNLFVGETYVMNVGLSATRERILKNGIGVLITPNNDNAKVIINHSGQRKAIAHECSRLMGAERYVETRRNFDTGEIVMVIVPIKKDLSQLFEIIKSVPILETLKKKEN